MDGKINTLQEKCNGLQLIVNNQNVPIQSLHQSSSSITDQHNAILKIVDNLTITIDHLNNKLPSCFSNQQFDSLSLRSQKNTSQLVSSTSTSETYPLPNEDTLTKVLSHQNSHPSPIKSPPSAVPITITGSSIIRNLLPGIMNYNGKDCNIKIRTKGGAYINHISNLVKTNRIDKQFSDSKHVIISTGSIDIKRITPEPAIQNIRSLIRTFKEKFPDTSLALCTLPYQYDPSLKPSLQQQLNKDIEDFTLFLFLDLF
ncbi:unnamed protein product [Didymodactylos carnosus]|uniref:Uncharacterized protein n=1 Tax=Didymodactylos carnosus TaxID=1234261 RepID=A0A8S2ID54_9BILA|nr:unnamed protein product [Didymodactylos carnosus]CAF3745077.1 unnamed protein product [Didymodactylos carnosus]